MGETFVFRWNCKYPPLRLHLTTGYQCRNRERHNIVLLGSWASATVVVVDSIWIPKKSEWNEIKCSKRVDDGGNWMQRMCCCCDGFHSVHFRANSNESIGYGNYTYGHNLQPTDSRFWNPTVPACLSFGLSHLTLSLSTPTTVQRKKQELFATHRNICQVGVHSPDFKRNESTNWTYSNAT